MNQDLAEMPLEDDIADNDEGAPENPTATIIPVALPAARYPNTFNSRPISHFP